MALRDLFARPAAPAAPADPAEPRLTALLDRLAGAGQGAALLHRLRAGDEPVFEIARALGRSAEFAALYKEARTADIGVEGRREADAAFVGIPDLPTGLPFAAQFERYYRPRLGRRAEGFAAIFTALAGVREPVVLETGCLRIPGNWEGDGQSSFMFDALTRDAGGLFFSVDITLEAVETARRACSASAQLILNDSVAALYALARALPRPASLLYLDSFDVALENPLPSAIHHALELAAARPLLGPGSIVCVDDFGFGEQGGKGMIVDRFFAAIGAEVLYSGYQKAWRLR